MHSHNAVPRRGLTSTDSEVPLPAGIGFPRPAQGPGPDLIRHGVGKWLLAGGVGAAIVGAMALNWARQTGGLPPRLATLFNQNYVASPFFSVEAFRTVKPGMTEEEVRRRLGYPLERDGLRPAECLWTYTVPRGEKGWYLHCTAAFDAASGRVLRVREKWTSMSRGCEPLWTDRVRREVGPIRLWRADGSELRLTPETDRPHLLLLDTGWPPSPEDLPSVTAAEFLRAGLAEAGLDGINVAIVRVPLAFPPEGGDFAGSRPAPAEAYDGIEPPPGPVQDSLCLVYHRGVIYALPAVEFPEPNEPWTDDLKYLLDRLESGPNRR